MGTAPENQQATKDDYTSLVRVIRRGDALRPLPLHARSLPDLMFAVGDVRVGGYLILCRTIGLLIPKNGEIALERYDVVGAKSRRTSYSKSITATPVGTALHDGAIGSLNDRCDLYLPRLRSSECESARLPQANKQTTHKMKKAMS